MRAGRSGDILAFKRLIQVRASNSGTSIFASYEAAMTGRVINQSSAA
jgi:hypothetical protein